MMTIDYSIYYEDGTNMIIQVDQSPRLHPGSIETMQTAIELAETSGLKVAKIGRPMIRLGKVVEAVNFDREFIMAIV